MNAPWTPEQEKAVLRAEVELLRARVGEATTPPVTFAELYAEICKRAQQVDRLQYRLDAVTAYVYLMERHGLADPHVTAHLRHLLGGET